MCSTTSISLVLITARGRAGAARARAAAPPRRGFSTRRGPPRRLRHAGELLREPLPGQGHLRRRPGGAERQGQGQGQGPALRGHGHLRAGRRRGLRHRVGPDGPVAGAPRAGHPRARGLRRGPRGRRRALQPAQGQARRALHRREARRRPRQRPREEGRHERGPHDERAGLPLGRLQRRGPVRRRLRGRRRPRRAPRGDGARRRRRDRHVRQARVARRGPLFATAGPARELTDLFCLLRSTALPALFLGILVRVEVAVRTHRARTLARCRHGR